MLKFPEHGDSRASSSHEVSLEPIFKRREDLCKHNVHTHFLKTEIARSARGRKLQVSCVGELMVEPYLVMKILVI